MSDYWKSLPRKFCDTCKCWFADNKASIEFHEKGKKHKENVEKRINQIQKKGLKDFKKKQKLENEMDKIEKAALKAFQKDMEQNPTLAEQYKDSFVSEPEPSQEVPTRSEPTSQNRTAPANIGQECANALTDKKASRLWYEGTSDEGHKYYWNSVTSESSWEPPEEGFISIEEQNEQKPIVSQSKKKRASKKPKSETVDTPDIPSNTMGPMPKPDPYGQWVTVEPVVPEVIDWQLPQRTENTTEVHIPLSKDDTFKIREKTIGHLYDESGEITFKKRKNLGGAKRNIRQRLDDT